MTRRTPAQYNWSRLEFDETILTKHFSKRSKKNVKYVVVHHMTIVGNGKGSALAACYNVWQTRKASAHYGVDGNLVRQYVWDKDYAWATGSTAGNEHGISIEHANSTAGPKWLVSETTWKTGARLAAHLHKTYKLGRPVGGKTLRKHSDFTSTACPGPYLGGSQWAAYVAYAQLVYDEITGAKPPVVVPPVTNPKSHKVVAGDTLGKIATRFKVSVANLVKWNRIGNPNVINVGQVLTLVAPPSEPTPDPDLGPLVISADLNAGSYNATGAKTYKERTDTYVARRLRYECDVLNLQEVGNGLGTKTHPNCRMRGRLDAGFGKTYRRHIGSDGRYVYSNTSAVKPIKSGVITTAKTSWYRKDDKQAAYLVFAKDDVRAMDVTFHLEHESGPVADAKRVDQMLSIVAQALDIAKANGVDRRNILFTGDTNSEGMVAAAMKAAGWRNVAAGTDLEDEHTFMGWDGRSRKRFDYGFVHEDAAEAELTALHQDTDVSDHAELVIARRLTK